MKKMRIFLLLMIFPLLGISQTVTVYDSLNSSIGTSSEDYRTAAIKKMDSEIWIGEGQSCNRFDGTNWVNFSYSDMNCPWEWIWIYDFEKDADGNIWASGTGGLFKYDGTTWSHYGEGTPGIEPGTDYFGEMVIAPDGKIWILGGNTVWAWLYSVDPATMTFTYYNRDDYPMLDDNIQDIALNSDNEIILTGTDNGYVVFDPSTITFTAHPATINFTMSYDDHGNYWSGGWRNDDPHGLFKYDSDFNEIAVFNNTNSLIPRELIFKQSYCDIAGFEGIWFHGSDELLGAGNVCVYDTAKNYFLYFDETSGMPNGKVSRFCFEGTNVWMTADNIGVMKIDLSASPYIGIDSGYVEVDAYLGSDETISFNIHNRGGNTLNYGLDFTGATWLSAESVSGTVTTTSVAHEIEVQGSEMTSPGIYEAVFEIHSNGGNIPVKVIVNADYSITDATLSDLKVNGATVTDFNPATHTYEVVLPYGTTTVPSVEATTFNPDASLVVNNASSLPGASTVVVTAEDGTTELTYTVNFTVAPAGTDATLSDLTVDGTTVSGFAASTHSYDVTLPYGTTEIPVVAATTSDENASHVVNAATALPGATEVVVTAEDGTTTLTYSVNFTVASGNNDATLSDLTVDGSTISDFNSATYTYQVLLPYGTTEVPVVAATTSDENASHVVNAATALPGTTEVVVTAEDGSTTLTYAVEFDVESGIFTISEKDIKIYPNPSNGVFYVELGEKADIEILDITGKTVYQGSIVNKKMIDISNNPAGSYILLVKNGDKVLSVNIQLN